MQSTMSTTTASKTGSGARAIYDSYGETTNGSKRQGTSATEIELLDDIPPSFNAPRSTFETASSAAQNGYQALFVNPPADRPNVMYQNDNDQQLNSAVDKLLEKYAPDATPQNLTSTSASRRSASQTNNGTSREEPWRSTGQPSASNNYSTIIRPKAGSLPQNEASSTSNAPRQPAASSRPRTTYDSFQHMIPQQQMPSSSAPITTKRANVTQVVPGKLYNLDDDPLHLFYDRQNPVAPTPRQAQPQAPPSRSFNSTFQPSSRSQAVQDPLAFMLNHPLPGQAQQPIMLDPSSSTEQPFDLSNLIRRVQQEYLLEVQPFVSSVKFVEKDRQYGQGIDDIGFTTPVTVRKGFTTKANDLLRGSIGKRANPLVPEDSYSYDEYSDEDEQVSELYPRHKQPSGDPLDSRQSMTSVTSVSTDASDYDDRYSPRRNNKPKKHDVHDQGTSSSPVPNATKEQPPASVVSNSTVAAIAAASTASKIEPTASGHMDERGIGPTGMTPKLARRIPTEERSDTSAESSNSGDEDTYSANYNEHERPADVPTTNPRSVAAMATSAPVVKPTDDAVRRRAVETASSAQRSEDIHPTPPTLRSSQAKPTLARSAPTNNESDSPSGSDTDGEEKLSFSVKLAPATTTAVRFSPPAATGPSVAPPTGRDAVASNARTNQESAAPAARGAAVVNARTTQESAPPTGRDAVASNARTTQDSAAPAARGAAVVNARTTQESAAPAGRDAVASNARGAPGPTANPNTHSVPPDQRAAPADRFTPSAPATQAAPVSQTGSTRFFNSDTDPKSGRKRTDKEESAGGVGGKLKSIKNLFRRS